MERRPTGRSDPRRRARSAVGVSVGRQAAPPGRSRTPGAGDPMTDTLSDSRTTSRTFVEGVPVVVEDVRRRPAAERGGQLADPGFGRYFTDSMFVARYRGGEGWVDARLTAYGPLSLDPSTAALHYAQSIFEGLKAYAQPDGSVATFRPEANAARFTRSARRLAMPPVPEEAFITAVDALVDADRDWVPTGPDQTLYLRPYQLAVEPFLGVRPANEYLFLVIASPAGAYFSRGVHPVSVWLSEEYIRAAPAARATPSAPATTPPACSRRSRRPPRAATRSSGSTRWRSATSRRWAG